MSKSNRTDMTTNVPVSPHNRWGDMCAFAALIIAVACGIWPLWTPGWPFNHEELYFTQRAGVFAAHFNQGDWLPLWASADNRGFGSPQPALYHKLFSFVSGAAYWLGHDMKLALMMTTAFFLFIGAGGMRFLLRTLGAGRISGLAGGICLIFANYTATNWLVRGALAEFSGAMLVPWGMAFFLRVIHRKRRTKDAIALGLCFSLLFLAHSVLAYFLVLLLPVLAVALWGGWGLRLERGLTSRLILASGITLLLLTPVLFAMLQLGHAYDLTRILPSKYLPANQLQPLSRYFWDSYVFGHDFRAYTIQLDTVPLAVALLGGTWLLCARLHAPEAWAMLLLVAVILLLQTRVGVLVYTALPGGNYIQFPWRLMAVATPCLIAAAVLILSRFALAAGWGEGGAAATALIMAALCIPHSGSLSKLDYGRYSAQELATWQTRPVVFSLFGEYLPRMFPLTYGALDPEPWALRQGCQIKEEGDSSLFEPLSRHFVTECAGKAILALPLFGSPYHGLMVNGQSATCQNLAELPGLCAMAVPAGTSEIEVRIPTFNSLLKTWGVLGAEGRQATDS